MSDNKNRSMFGENHPEAQPHDEGGGVFADIVKVQGSSDVELAANHKTGLLKKRRRLVRILVVSASLMGLLWAVGTWIGEVASATSSVGFQAARNIDKPAFEAWLYNDMVASGYSGDPFVVSENAIVDSVGRMYTSVLDATLIDSTQAATWDLGPVLVYADLDGEYEILPFTLDFPFDVAKAVKILSSFTLIFGGLAVGLLIGALWLAKEGGTAAVGWTLRISGWRWAVAGGLSVVWMLWQTAKFEAQPPQVNGPWLARNLSMEVIGWNPVPYVVLGLIGMALLGIGIVLRERR